MINGVLTERTVKEVVPILKTNSDGLKKALEELVKQYKTKQDEMEKWKVSLTLSPAPCVSCPAKRVRLGTLCADAGVTWRTSAPNWWLGKRC